MSNIEGEVFINRPVETVFDFVADERNEPLYNSQMLRAEKASDGLIGPGTSFRNYRQTPGETYLEYP